MRYYFVSDIHGEYDKLILALADAGFDMEKDTIVSLGDPFDRGYKSKEVLEFLLSCPNRILVIGNHDWRLKQLIHNPNLWTQYDYTNGVPATYKSFAEVEPNEVLLYWEGLDKLSGNEQLHQYFEEAVLYVEFKDLIAVHGWIPFYEKDNKHFEPYKGDWHEASRAEWEGATWAHTQLCCNNGIFPEKRLLVGHWHAWRLAEAYGEKREDPTKPMVFCGKTIKNMDYIDCNPFVTEQLIAIDGCVNYLNGGKVNVFIYETEEEPRTLLYKNCK